MEIVPLAVWYPAMAAKWTKRRPVAESARTHWVHHHSAGGTTSDPLRYARSTADFHYAKWGVPGGYNYLIGLDGTVFEMCGREYEGVHSGSGIWNRRGVALCYQGDYRTRPPSDVMLDSARELLATWDLPQTYHRAIRPYVNGKPSTTCPGAALIALLPLEVDDMPSADEVRAIFREELDRRQDGRPGPVNEFRGITHGVHSAKPGGDDFPSSWQIDIRTYAGVQVLLKEIVDADPQTLVDLIKSLPDETVDLIKDRL